MNALERYNYCLEWRGIEPDAACQECGGAGIKAYGSTATWRGGIGGQAITNDVCDKCWGSGDRYRPWPSHRLLRQSPTTLPSLKDGQ